MHDVSNSASDARKENAQHRRVGRETRNMLHQIFHASPSPIAINRLSDGTFLDVNEEWSSFFGYTIEEVYGRSFSDLGIWARDEQQQEYMRRLRERFSVHEFEIDVRTSSGESKTVVCSSQIIEVEGEQCVLTVMNDITEHKRTRNALKESEERFRMMADSAPVLIWVADESGECIYFNKPWLEFTGRSLEEDEGKGWHQNVHPDDFDSCRSNYARALENRETFSTEYRLRRHDGEYRWVLDRGIPRYNADGSFAGFIGSVIDINEQKDTEQKMLEAKEHAEEMAKLKSTFLTNMTHEIRTPLTVILGFTSILRQGVRPEYHRFVNLIDRSGRRLLLMLDSMLDLAQLEAGTLEIEAHSESVTEIVESVALTVMPLARDRGLDLNLSLPSDRCYAIVDHGVLSRVLNNMLDNAIKFTEEGSIDLAVRREGSTIVITITDTGIGIDERFLAQAFDPFTQESSGLDRSHQGSGLGLTVSKRLLELMNGKIQVDSKKDAGSVFTISLPSTR